MISKVALHGKKKMGKKRILITGGTGFVGSHMIEHIMKNTNWEVVCMSRLNFAGDMHRIMDADYIKPYLDRIQFVYQDLQFSISPSMSERIGNIDYILHLAANSHVDRSITHPKEFFMDNVIGTVNLLEYARTLPNLKKFINFGTDEVFGAANDDYNFTEEDRWRPSNPYSASKCGQLAAGISYYTTYGLPVITTYTMNIFGERQNPEKLMPLCINKILNDEPITIHSKLDCVDFTTNENEVLEIGERHWLHARNAADAILFLFDKGESGEHYNVVGDTELRNDEVARLIGKVIGKEPILQYEDFHSCRAGHDRRYALDGFKLHQMGWRPPLTFEDSLKNMIKWEIENVKRKRDM